MGYSAEEKLTEVRRELRMREQVYKAMVEDERMSADTARKRIEIMSEIAEDYEKMAQDERLL